MTILCQFHSFTDIAQQFLSKAQYGKRIHNTKPFGQTFCICAKDINMFKHIQTFWVFYDLNDNSATAYLNTQTNMTSISRLINFETLNT